MTLPDVVLLPKLVVFVRLKNILDVDWVTFANSRELETNKVSHWMVADVLSASIAYNLSLI